MSRRFKRKLLSSKKYNTFIGGVSASITSAALLATEMDISPTAIKSFETDGENIKCYINTPYVMGINAFEANTDITYFLDNEGMCNQLGDISFLNKTFQQATNLRYIYFPSPLIIYIGQGTFEGCPILKWEFLSLISITGNFIDGFWNGCRYISMPLLISDESYRASKPQYLNIPNAVGGYMREMTKNSFENNSFLTVSSSGFQNTLIPFINLPNVTTLTGSAFYRLSIADTIRLDNVASVGGSCFRKVVTDGGSSPNRFYLPRCVDYGGDNTVYTSVFRDITLGMNIYIDPSMLTINAGGLEADLAYAQNTRGATLIPVTNFNTPNAVTDLSYNNVVVDSGVTVTTLTKKIKDTWGSCGAESTNSIAGNGYLEFEALETNTHRMLGLSTTNINDDWRTIEFALYLRNNSNVEVREGSTSLHSEPYLIGDVFKIERVGTTIQYFKNGISFYTSLQIAPLTNLIADCSINTIDGTIYNANLNGTLVVWTNINGCSAFSTDLNFTAPTINTNPNDYYDVYVRINDRTILGWNPPAESIDTGDIPDKWEWLQEISSSGDTITGLDSVKTHDIKILTGDTLGNRSGDSNIIQI